jgi:hypothetical protein
MNLHSTIFAGDQYAGSQFNLYRPSQYPEGRGKIEIYELGCAAISEGWLIRERGQFGILRHDTLLLRDAVTTQ